ncbi:beta-ketoacyl synthase N-terminal-like domain-containing protein [Acanthopleuribacter pedis]|uniref:Polyketide synthase dehydratase domain-containing protein n=1 Tax=Acanthopleuribacter pedis TaxID=442870 RepID=A0A8J7U5T0_9BACT|nr:beta-ketoacyl synthase N-terminal-like domain-containing protein [Acanthopleuribacter pedis]MBO1322037.1 polyketide synthase dehydratase domain-containing protein [Acanthopleuribacter pedis]
MKKAAFILSKEHPILGNHKAHGHALLPGLAYIDIIYRFFLQNGFEYPELELKNLSIFRPLIPPDGGAVRVFVRGEPKNGDDRVRDVRIEGLALDAHGEADLFAAAEVVHREPVRFDETLDLSALTAQAREETDLAACYDVCRDNELVHTGIMKAEGRIFRLDDSLLVDLSLAEPYRAGGQDALFHPTLIDSAGVAGSLLFPEFVPAEDAGKLFLPLFFQSFRAAATLQDRTWCRIPLDSVSRKNELLYMDLAFFNDAGEKIAELGRFTNKLVRSSALINPGGSDAKKRKTGAVKDSAEALKAGAETSKPQPTPPAAAAAGTVADMLGFLKEIVARALGRAPAEIDAESDYYEMGLESSMLLEIVTEVGKKLSLDLAPTLLFEYATLAELAVFLADETGAVPANSAPANGAPANSEPKPEQLEKTLPQAATPPITQPAAPPIRAVEPAAQIRAVEPAAPHAGDIAVIGMSGAFPKAADLRAFWRNLKNGKDCVGPIPNTRWNTDDFTHITSPTGKEMPRWAGLLDDVDQFDPMFFKIPPLEAKYVDPQCRLFLQAVWNAVEDAGYTPATLDPGGDRNLNQVGVFAGIMNNDYQSVLLEALAAEERAAFPVSQSFAPVANRVSHFFNFHGPSMSVDTVCSSALTALHWALTAMASGQCRVAVVGGVNLCLHPSKLISYSMTNLYSGKEKSGPFAAADGYVPGEGIGAVILKPLADALRDGDHVYGVIKASVMGHGGGKGGGFMIPKPNAQAAFIKRLFAQAGVKPETISYVESSALGDEIWDSIEVAGLTKAFATGPGSCPIGSVKSNIGHTEAASGMAQLIKVMLQLKHGLLTPSIHADAFPANQHIQWGRSPFRIQRETTLWRRPVQGEVELPRRAVICNVGATISYSSLLVEECTHSAKPTPLDQPQLVPLSAAKPAILLQRARDLLAFLENDDASLVDIAFTLRVGREHMAERLAIPAPSKEALSAALANFIADPDQNNAGFVRGAVTDPEREKVTDLFGAGSQAMLLDETLASGDLEKAARLWVLGFKIPLETLGTRGRRISLPGYPFEKRRCWVTPAAKQPTRNALAAQPQQTVVMPERKKSPERTHYDVVIVGAGIAGLIAACYLQQKGKAVLILEYHGLPGGYLQNYKRKGYDVDAVTAFYPFVEPDEIIGRALQELGIAMDWIDCAVTPFRVTPDEGVVPIEFKIGAKTQEENAFDIFRNFTPGYERELKDMLRYIFNDALIEREEEHYNRLTFGAFLGRFLPERFHRHFYLPFSNPTDPIEDTAFIAYRVVFKMFIGVPQYYPAGGSKNLIGKLVERFRALGGTLKFRRKVLRVNVSGEKVRGVVTAKGEYTGDDTILACSPRQIFDAMYEDDKQVDNAYLRKVRALKPCMPSCVLSVFFDGKLDQWLEADELRHNLHAMYIFDHEDGVAPERVLDRFDIKYLYCVCPTQLDARLGAKGDYVVATVEVPYLEPAFWKENAAEIGEAFMARFYACFPKLRGHVANFELATPPTMEKYTLNYKGAISGWAMTVDQAGKERLPQTTPWRNLFLAGHWAFPGARIAMSVESGRLVSRLVGAAAQPADSASKPLKTNLLDLVSRLLGYEPDEIDADKPFAEYGVDSILGLQLIRQLEESHGIVVKARDFIEHPTPAALIAFLDAKAPSPDAPSADAPSQSSTPPVATPPTTEVAAPAAEAPPDDGARERELLERFKRGELSLDEIKSLV